MNREIFKIKRCLGSGIMALGFMLITACAGNDSATTESPASDPGYEEPVTPSPSPSPEVVGACLNTGSQPELSTHRGDATFYAADGTGNCSFPASPNNLIVAAMNTADYAGSAMCGACVVVTGPSGSVVVKIVDRCPGCLQGDVDLSAEAFAKIADPADGRVDVSWQEVPCDTPDSMAYHFKSGSNQWWSAVQLRNHRHRIDSLEVLNQNGQYQPVPRKNYNYFVAEEGFGVGPLSFRVTDIYGNKIEDSSIPLVANSIVQSHTQFPDCTQ